MKIKQLLIVSVAVCALSLTSCDKQSEDYTTDDSNKIKLEARVNSPLTKAAYSTSGLLDNSFNNGTTVKVYFFDTGTDNYYNSGTEATCKLDYTVNSDGTMSTEANEIAYGDGTVDIFAVYPSTHSLCTISGGYLPSFISEDQSTQEKYLANDFMIAQVLNKDKSTGRATLSFTHQLSRVHITIDGTAAGVDPTTITDVKVIIPISGYRHHRNASGGVTGTNSFSGSGGGQKTILLGNNTTSSGVVCIVPPQTIPTTQAFIEFTLGGNTYQYTPTSQLTLASGYQYNLKLSIDDGANVKLKSSSVTPWDKTDLPDGTAYK